MEQLNKKNTDILAKGALFLATIIWGSTFFILKNTLEDTPVSFILAIRFFIAFVALSLIFFKSYKYLNINILWKGALAGVVIAAAYIVQTIGLKYTSPGNNAFITASYCIIVPFLFWLFVKKRPDKYKIISALICFAGVGLVSVKEDVFFGKGEALTLLSGFLFALHIVIIATLAKDKNIALFTIIQFLTAGLCCLMNFAIFEEFPQNISQNSILSIVYLGLFATAGALTLQNFGQKYTNPTSTSIILSFEAVFGLMFSMIFYGEKLLPKTAIGFSLIFLALIISETKLKIPFKTHKYVSNKDISWLVDNPLIHRGDFSDIAPENSLKAFSNAVEKGYSIELDVQLTFDGEMVVFHDSSLKRMCGAHGKVSKRTLSELKKLTLKGTKEKIPTLKEVLELVSGKVGLVIELKTYIKHRKVCEKLAVELQGYDGNFTVHSFSPYAMRWVGINHPEWTHGIVSVNYQRFGLIGILGQWLTNIPFFDVIKPDYIFYLYSHLDTPFVKKEKLRGVKTLCWTIKTGEQLMLASILADNYLCEGAIIEYADKRNK